MGEAADVLLVLDLNEFGRMNGVLSSSKCVDFTVETHHDVIIFSLRTEPKNENGELTVISWINKNMIVWLWNKQCTAQTIEDTIE